MSFSRLLRFLALALFIASTLVRAEDPLSPSELEGLLLTHVKRIPELALFWQKNPDAPVYFGGGALRGLIHYVEREARSKGYAAALRSPTPSINQLLLQEWSDRDLVAPENWKAYVKNQLPGQDWDILSTDFMKASTRAGGATIEKVMVNPREIIDPYGALPAYLRKELVFISPGNPALLNSGLLNGNTLTAMGLRFLRFSQNLPDADITPQSWKELRNISIEEWNELRRGTANDYWILKGLKKLYHSVNRDEGSYLELLHSADLLGLLARHHYSLPQDEVVNPRTFSRFMQGIGHGWTLKEKLDAAEVLGPTKHDKFLLLDALAQGHQNAFFHNQIAERKSLIQHVVHKFGENDLHGHQRQNAPVQVNGFNVNMGPAGHILVNGMPAQAPRVNLPGGGVQFNVQLPNGQCAAIQVKIGLGH